ncbi:MAG: hypothetical protein Q6K80_04470 [Thermostichus sp. DG_1_6_bins_120]
MTMTNPDHARDPCLGIPFVARCSEELFCYRDAAGSLVSLWARHAKELPC